MRIIPTSLSDLVLVPLWEVALLRVKQAFQSFVFARQVWVNLEPLKLDEVWIQ